MIILWVAQRSPIENPADSVTRPRSPGRVGVRGRGARDLNLYAVALRVAFPTSLARRAWRPLWARDEVKPRWGYHGRGRELDFVPRPLRAASGVQPFPATRTATKATPQGMGTPCRDSDRIPAWSFEGALFQRRSRLEAKTGSTTGSRRPQV